MPWWVWVALALFMLAMLVAGLVYVAIHAARGVRSAGRVTTAMGERLAAMGEPDPAGERRHDTTPIYTLPLSEAAGRYSDAHAGVIRRKADKRDRHAAAWQRWDEAEIWRAEVPGQRPGRDSDPQI